MSEPTSITYAELRDDDILIDKSGGRWHVSGVEAWHPEKIEISFWLGDARTKVRAHHMTKPAGDPCTVDRAETLRDTVEKLEAQWPKDPSQTPVADGPPIASDSSASEKSATPRTETGAAEAEPWAWLKETDEQQHEAAVVAVEQEMPGAKIDTDSTAAEVDAAAKSTDDDPVVLPLFETMTPLEQRSHLFVLHGVFADDLDDAKTLCDLHFNVTRDRAQLKLRSVYKPHEHSASVK
jgi:hypothetical protein